MHFSTDDSHRVCSARFPALGSFGIVAALIAAPLVSGCKKDEPPPPLPAAQAPAPAAPEPLKLQNDEDAGKPKKVEKKPVATGAAPAVNLTACCAALRQNAENAPDPTKTYMLQAAAYCDALAKQGADKSSMIAAVSGMLRGAHLPAGCR